MKRSKFLITSTAGHRVEKSKWNSSLRHVEALARQIARDHNRTLVLVEKQSERDDSGYHVKGLRVWSDQQSKLEFRVEFRIEKQASA